MGRKLIPSADIEFIGRAESFAQNISKDPGRFNLTQTDAQAMIEAAAQFRAAYQANLFGAKSQAGTRAKNQARAKTKAIFTRLTNIIRISESVSADARFAAGIKDRPQRLSPRECPQEPPQLRFVRALHQNAATPIHELQFLALHACSKAKPPGAVRLELFVDLIPPDEPIPTHPGANHGGRPWYLRSFTRSPIKIAPPMTRVPMRVVYWGRWADSTGNVGPFSATASAWIEGGSHQPWIGAFGSNKPAPLLTDSTGPAGRESDYSVVVVEAQYQSLHPQRIAARQLPDSGEREPRQLEGPASEAA